MSTSCYDFFFFFWAQHNKSHENTTQKRILQHADFIPFLYLYIYIPELVSCLYCCCPPLPYPIYIVNIGFQLQNFASLSFIVHSLALRSLVKQGAICIFDSRMCAPRIFHSNAGRRRTYIATFMVLYIQCLCHSFSLRARGEKQ